MAQSSSHMSFACLQMPDELSALIQGIVRFRSPMHMTPGALPRGNPRLPATARTSRRTAARAPQARAQPSASALRPSMLRTRDSLAQPCANSHHFAHTVQHLPSIPSLRIA